MARGERPPGGDGRASSGDTRAAVRRPPAGADGEPRRGRPQPTCSEAVLVKAARLLHDLADLWRQATPEQRAELAATLFSEVRVRDKAIAGATLAQPEYLPLVASATWRNAAGEAPPDGLEPPTQALGRPRSIH